MATFTPPFAQEAPKPAAPTAAPVAPSLTPPQPPQETAPEVMQDETLETAQAAEDEKQPTERKKMVRKATRTIDKNDILYVCTNVPTMPYNDMAEKLGLTRHQVNRILMDIKNQLRKSYINEDGTEDLAKKEIIEAYIARDLSRPDDARIGSSKKVSPVRDAMNDVVSEILNKL